MSLALGIGFAVCRKPPRSTDKDKKRKNRAWRGRQWRGRKLSPKTPESEISMEEARAIALTESRNGSEKNSKGNEGCNTLWHPHADVKSLRCRIDAMTGEVLQAVEDDDEDGDDEITANSPQKEKRFIRTAKTVKKVTVRTVDSFFNVTLVIVSASCFKNEWQIAEKLIRFVNWVWLFCNYSPTLEFNFSSTIFLIAQCKRMFVFQNPRRSVSDGGPYLNLNRFFARYSAVI